MLSFTLLKMKFGDALGGGGGALKTPPEDNSTGALLC